MLLATLAIALSHAACQRFVCSHAPAAATSAVDGDARTRNRQAAWPLYLTSPTPPADTTLRRYGRYRRRPLARWGTVFLPHQQEALNIYEPQWVLLFEALLATPPPWLYAAAFLPGGSANLDNPAFALPERGERIGTLLLVVDAVRQPDSKLTLAVQAIGRCHVERVTQTLPYGRADVQLFPDAEQLLLASGVAGDAVVLPAESLAARRRHERRRTLAAAACGDDAWRAYEHAKPVLSERAALAQQRPRARLGAGRRR